MLQTMPSDDRPPDQSDDSPLEWDSPFPDSEPTPAEPPEPEPDHPRGRGVPVTNPFVLEMIAERKARMEAGEPSTPPRKRRNNARTGDTPRKPAATGIHVYLPAEQIAAVEARAAELSINRQEWLRRVVTHALANPRSTKQTKTVEVDEST